MFEGHTLHPIPNIRNLDFKNYGKSLDCLVITGGDNDPLRVHNELNLIINFRALNKPIIGICHGAFLLTKVCSGKIEPSDNHYNKDHRVFYLTDSKYYTVNSFHGAVITKVSDKTTVLALDTDGHIESWIKGNIAAIIWHPERDKNMFIPDEIRDLYEGSQQ